jgi:hypothetical protein
MTLPSAQMLQVKKTLLLAVSFGMNAPVNILAKRPFI